MRDDTATVWQRPPALDTAKHALFLDLDGTLVDIAARPEDVVVGEELRLLLCTISARAEGAVALLTGRTIKSAEVVLGGAIDTIAGLHGFECRIRGEISRATDDLTSIRSAIDEARQLVEAGALQARIEDKGAGLALHCREAPEHCTAVRGTAEVLAEKHELTVLEGKMVAELTLGVRSKGDALSALMNEAPFVGRMPIAIGDDVTDEDAFRAASSCGGFGVFVGSPRTTRARFALENVASVSAWLQAGLSR